MVDSLNKIINIEFKSHVIYNEFKFSYSSIKKSFKNVNELIDYCSTLSYDCYISFGYNIIYSKNIFRLYIENICIINYSCKCKDKFIFKCSSSDEDDINDYINNSIVKNKRINTINYLLK